MKGTKEKGSRRGKNDKEIEQTNLVRKGQTSIIKNLFDN
jgi:hypothetical protein